MNNDNLERILEEAFQSVIQNNFPEAGTVLTQIGEQLRRNNSEGGQTVETEMTAEGETQTDMSFNTVPIQDATNPSSNLPTNNQSTSQHASTAQRSLPSLHARIANANTHIVDVTHHLFLNYHENMRLYQHNMSLMLRQLQTITRNQTASSSTSSVRQRQRTRMPSLFSNGNENLSLEIQTFPFYGIFPSSSGEALHSIPTIQQFTNATELCTYTEEDFGTISRTCPITLEEFQEDEQIYRIRHCRHFFKTSALQNWFSRNSHCPVCRYDIRTYEISPNPMVRTNSRSNSL